MKISLFSHLYWIICLFCKHSRVHKRICSWHFNVCRNSTKNNLSIFVQETNGSCQMLFAFVYIVWNVVYAFFSHCFLIESCVAALCSTFFFVNGWWFLAKNSFIFIWTSLLDLNWKAIYVQFNWSPSIQQQQNEFQFASFLQQHTNHPNEWKLIGTFSETIRKTLESLVNEYTSLKP